MDLMKTETPQRIHRQDYTPPPFLVDQVELDVQFLARRSAGQQPAAPAAQSGPPPGQPLQLDGHGLETSRWQSTAPRSAKTTTTCSDSR
jgi:hypothetical protein